MSVIPTPAPVPADMALPALCPPTLEGESTDQLRLMLANQPYLGADPYLCRVRDRGSAVLARANALTDADKRMGVLRSFLDFRPGERDGGGIGGNFLCEYGFNVSIGDDVWIGPNCTFLDVAKIHIGSRTMIGANTQLYTPQHPLSFVKRNGTRGPEWALPITIGDDCWLGGGVVVCPGVTIGNGVVVGAGAVVSKSIEDRCVVVGNPARVIKRLDEDGEVIQA